MPKELVIIYDTPSVTYIHQIKVHNLHFYLKFFDRLHILYWSKEKFSEIFEKEGGKFIFYPYPAPYNLGGGAALKYMFWIVRILWRICESIPKNTKLIFMPIMPLRPGIPALIVGKLKGKKVILRLEAHKIEHLKEADKLAGTPKIFTFIKVTILKIIYYDTLPFFDYVIGISEGIAREARRFGAKKIVKIPIPVNIDNFLSKSESFDDKKEVILFVGQIKKAKGIHNLIEALHILKKEEGLAPKLLIAGDITSQKDTSFHRELKNMIRGLDVEFLGWISHEKLPEIYKKADIFVLPSFSEGLGMALMEAMASELPVIATKTSGSRDLIEEGVSGFLVEIREPRALKEKMALLLKDQNLRESMARAGRKRIEELMLAAEKEYEKLWKDLEL